MEELIDHDGFAKELPGIRQKLKIGKENNEKPFVRSSITKQCRRILVVDDEKSIQEVLKALLSAMGYEVISAGSGHDGLQLFFENWDESWYLIDFNSRYLMEEPWILRCRFNKVFRSKRAPI